MDAPAQLTRRNVVSCFIFKTLSPRSPTPRSVALFRRSSKVRTYQHKLAPISGTVESTDLSPLAAAWRELAEETTLTTESLRLRRRGKPYSFVDEALAREWTIFPFAFDLVSTSATSSGEDGGERGRVEEKGKVGEKGEAEEKSEAGGKEDSGIVIDWEHDSWSWHDPRSVTDHPSFNGVPNLATSLRRAWFEYDLGDVPGQILASGLESLQSDHENGARVLAGNALEILTDVAASLAASAQDQWWRDVRMAGWHLWKNGRESMGAAILSVVLASLRELELEVLPRWTTLPADGRETPIRAALGRYAERRQHLNSDISRSFRSFLSTSTSPVRILTLSSSSIVTQSLIDAINDAPFTFDVRVLESRPLFEGASAASAFASAMIRANAAGGRNNTVTVYTDAAAAIASKDVHLVLLGADMISSSGDTCNKTGSLPAVLSAKHVSPGCRVVVVADREKIYPFAPPEREENDGGEVTGAWDDAAAGVFRDMSGHVGNVRNVYFEWVDSRFVDSYVLEDRHGTIEDLGKAAADVERSADHFFGDL